MTTLLTIDADVRFVILDFVVNTPQRHQHPYPKQHPTTEPGRKSKTPTRIPHSKLYNAYGLLLTCSQLHAETKELLSRKISKNYAVEYLVSLDYEKKLDLHDANALKIIKLFHERGRGSWTVEQLEHNLMRDIDDNPSFGTPLQSYEPFKHKGRSRSGKEMVQRLNENFRELYARLPKRSETPVLSFHCFDPVAGYYSSVRGVLDGIIHRMVTKTQPIRTLIPIPPTGEIDTLTITLSFQGHAKKDNKEGEDWFMDKMVQRITEKPIPFRPRDRTFTRELHLPRIMRYVLDMYMPKTEKRRSVRRLEFHVKYFTSDFMSPQVTLDDVVQNPHGRLKFESTSLHARTPENHIRIKNILERREFCYDQIFAYMLEEAEETVLYIDGHECHDNEEKVEHELSPGEDFSSDESEDEDDDGDEDPSSDEAEGDNDENASSDEAGGDDDDDDDDRMDDDDYTSE